MSSAPKPLSSEQILVCWTTVGDSDQADQLATQLIARNVAACVQIDAPIVSHYYWEGETNRDPEVRLMIKTSLDAAERLMQTIQKLHPYDQPQIVMVQSSFVAPGYAAWVRQSTPG